MTFHRIGSYCQPATGGNCVGGADQSKSPRIAASLNPDDFRRLAWLAHREAVPLGEIVRRAVAAYLEAFGKGSRQAPQEGLPIRSDWLLPLGQPRAAERGVTP